MGDAVIAAIITGAVSVFGTVVAVLMAHNKTVAAMDKHQAVTDTKIDELSRRVEKHNQIVERTYVLEGAVRELQHEVRDLKGGQNHEAE